MEKSEIFTQCVSKPPLQIRFYEFFSQKSIMVVINEKTPKRSFMPRLLIYTAQHNTAHYTRDPRVHTRGSTSHYLLPWTTANRVPSKSLVHGLGGPIDRGCHIYSGSVTTLHYLIVVSLLHKSGIYLVFNKPGRASHYNFINDICIICLSIKLLMVALVGTSRPR